MHMRLAAPSRSMSAAPLKWWWVAVPIALLVCIGFYPGYMTSDSLQQLREARSGTFTTWHPPLMAFVWRQFDRVVPGPIGMVVFHTLMFGAGLALFFNRRLGLIPIALVTLSPPVLGHLATVWKDVGMFCALVLAVGLYARGKPGWALVPLFYACCVRHNAMLAVVPLVL